MGQETSAGILLFSGDRVFLTHAGGPFNKNKDQWSIPKGHVEEGESHMDAAIREFTEETGIHVNGTYQFYDLGETKSRSGKRVIILAMKGRGDEKFNGSNMISIEYPKGSGNIVSIPENDKGEWFDLKEAYIKIYEYQKIFLERLSTLIMPTVIKEHSCSICGSSPGKPTSFKKFCSRCGNEP
jgi:predicted NUDIX family NTP pyrophosphohydrolase